MTDATTKIFGDPEDIASIEVGDYMVFHERVPWWRRLWRWVTRWKPPIVTITSVDRESGTITTGPTPS